jgi:TetR/AcrR family transcriptional regulator, transcriptional repressor for nem operon
VARPRTFDPDQVLDIAREVFWNNGYQNTTLDDITDATGLTKPSLYAAFGDKESLFSSVLDRYHDRLIARANRLLAENSSARLAIKTWLTSFVPVCSGPTGQRGCLSVNTALEGSVDSTVLGKSIARFNVQLEDLILKRLKADRAQFSADFDPVGAAQTVMTVYIGLMASAKQMPSAKRVKSIIEQTTKILA